MLCGKAAFPFKYDVEEHENRIKNCKFTFPDEVIEEEEKSDDGVIQFNLTTPAISVQLSEAAKKLIRSLIVANSKKRLSIDKIKQQKFFAGIKWSDVEFGRCKVPRVLLKEPKAENFDEISYDSDDEDFAHEFQSFEEASKPTQVAKSIDLKISNVDSNNKSTIKNDSIAFDEKSENQFEHLRELRSGQKKETSQKTDRNRLPTQLMVEQMAVRDKSVCISDDSRFYNKSSNRSDDSAS